MLLSFLLLACGRAQVSTVGDFEITLGARPRRFDPAEDAITVTTVADPDRVLWASSPGTDPVRVGLAGLEVESGGGSYVFDEEILSRCGGWTLEDAEEDGGALVLRGQLSDCATPWSLRFSAAATDRLAVQIEVDAPELNRVWWTGASDPDERLMGFGAQYSRLDMKGTDLPIWCQEQGIGRGDEVLTPLLEVRDGNPAGDWHTTYTCVPALVSDQGRGLALEGTGRVVFGMSDPELVSIQGAGTAMSGHILAGGDVPGVVSALTGLTGRMEPLPGWTQTGAVVRAGHGSEAVRARLAALQAAGVPVAALWIEDWCGVRETAFGDRLWWSWEPDASLYPDWAELVAELRAQDINVLIYVNPYLADASDKEGVVHNRYQEALEAGWLVEDASGAPAGLDQGGFTAGLVDLTDPEAVAWLQEILAEQVALGVSGWMADFAEALPLDAALADGSDPWLAHGAWPALWAELNAGVAAQTGVDLLTWHRSGNQYSPAAARLFWLGDQTVTWDANDGLSTVVPGLLSSGLSGYALQHTDAGGYLSASLLGITRDEELWARWVELAAFGALLRTHDTNEPDENVQVDTSDSTLAHFADMSALYAALAPVREEAMGEAAAHGWPLVRPVAWLAPDAPEAWDLTAELLLGDDVLMAPVLAAGATSVDVWLPPGTWRHLWSGVESGEGWTTVSAPVGEPAVFVRTDSEAGAAFLTAWAASGR